MSNLPTVLTVLSTVPVVLANLGMFALLAYVLAVKLQPLMGFIRLLVSPSLAGTFSRVSILCILGIMFWTCGCRAQVRGDLLSDQFPSPIGNFADMGSLFAAAFIVLGFAVCNILDKRGK
jgi:hypothetical protein